MLAAFREVEQQFFSAFIAVRLRRFAKSFTYDGRIHRDSKICKCSHYGSKTYSHEGVDIKLLAPN